MANAKRNCKIHFSFPFFALRFHVMTRMNQLHWAGGRMWGAHTQTMPSSLGSRAALAILCALVANYVIEKWEYMPQSDDKGLRSGLRPSVMCAPPGNMTIGRIQCSLCVCGLLQRVYELQKWILDFILSTIFPGRIRLFAMPSPFCAHYNAQLNLTHFECGSNEILFIVSILRIKIQGDKKKNSESSTTEKANHRRMEKI